MADRSVRVTLTANVSDYIAKLAAAGAQTEKLVTSTSKMSSREAWDKASTGLLAFGATAVGAAGLAIAKFSEFDTAMSNVRSTGEDARANIDALTDSAMKWGSETKYSATEAAGGIESLLKAGVSATDVIGGGLEGALSLAATGNLGVADSAEVAAIAMTQFGLAGSDIPHIADLIAAGAGKAQGDVSDMAFALKQSGLVASQFGLSIEETTGSLAAFASAGLIGSDAGTSFKTMLLRMSNPSAEAKTKMEELGIAAYDASGNFVGITDLAGQLKDKLADLPQAQRDAALATIFGSDAIRAANVLYEQGAEGIQGWIDQVNDAGYAAESAAIKQDNLAGDLEKLGGAFDTLLTKAGEASAGGLRSVVEDLTGFVDMLSRHGDAAGTLVAITGALGGLSLAAGGAMKAVTFAADFKASLDALGVISKVKTDIAALNKVLDASGTSWGRVGAGAAAVAAGLLIMQAVGSQIQTSMDESRNSVSDYGAALRETARDGELAASVQESFATAMTGTTGVTKDMAGAMQMLTDTPKPAEWLESSIMGLAGMKGNVQMAREEFEKLDTALVSVTPDQAAASFKLLAENMESTTTAAHPMIEAYLGSIGPLGETALNVGKLTGLLGEQKVTTDDIVAKFPEYANQLRSTAEALGVTSMSNEELLGWMKGVEPTSVAAARALASLGIAHVAAGASAEEQEAALKGLYDSTTTVATAAMAADAAQISYSQALSQAREVAQQGAVAYDEMTGKIDTSTEAGQLASSALIGLASAHQQAMDAAIANGTSMEDITAITQRNRDEFVEVATAILGNRDAAEQLADAYGLIPGQLSTDVSLTGADEAASKAEAVKAMIDTLPADLQVMIRSAYDDAARATAQASIEGLPPETQALIMSAWDAGGYETAVASLNLLPPETRAAILSTWDAAGVNAAIAGLNSVQSKTVTITSIYQAQYQSGALPSGYIDNWAVGLPKATGGSIWGPGTATSDDIPIWASNGEFVTRTWAAQRIGYDRLAYMNATGEIPRFRDGGPVQLPSASWQQPSVVSTTQQTQVVSAGDYLTRTDLNGMAIKILDPGIGKAIAAEIVLTAKRV